MSDPSRDELERLRAIEERHRLLFTNMGAAFALYQMVSDGAGQVVDAELLEVNPAYGELVGLPGESLVGRRMRQIMPYLDERWLAFLADVASTGRPGTRLDYVAEHDRYVDVRAYCPRLGQAAVQLYDVTEQKRAERLVRERDARLDALVSSAMDAIVSLDREQRVTW